MQKLEADVDIELIIRRKGPAGLSADNDWMDSSDIIMQKTKQVTCRAIQT